MQCEGHEQDLVVNHFRRPSGNQVLKVMKRKGIVKKVKISALAGHKL